MSHAKAIQVIQLHFPLTLQELIYDQMAMRTMTLNGRGPLPWDRPPNAADAESVVGELREQKRAAGLSEEEKTRELFDAINEAERQVHNSIHHFIQQAAEKTKEPHQAIERSRQLSKPILFFGAIIGFGGVLVLGLRWILPHVPINILIILFFAIAAAIIWDLCSTWRKAVAESGHFGEATAYLLGHIVGWSLISAAVYGTVWVIT